MHQPYFGGDFSSDDKQVKKEKDSENDGHTFKSEILYMKMSGIEYPLEERTVREMGFKHSADIFNKPWFVHINLKENQVQ